MTAQICREPPDGPALSSPAEEERGGLSAQLPPQFLFPTGQGFPLALTLLHFWVTLCKPLASLLGSHTLKSGISPTSRSGKRSQRLWLAADPPWAAELHELSWNQVPAMVVGAEQTAEV